MDMIPLTPHLRIPPRRLSLPLPPLQFPHQQSQKAFLPTIRMALNQRIRFLPQKKIQHQFSQFRSLFAHIVTEDRSRIIRRRYGIRSVSAASEFVNNAVLQSRYLIEQPTHISTPPHSTQPTPSQENQKKQKKQTCNQSPTFHNLTNRKYAGCGPSKLSCVNVLV